MQFSISNYVEGLITLPLLLALMLFVARQWRALFHWYIGLPFTKWWAMGLLVLAIKHMPTTAFFTLRAQGRLWLSPKNALFDDPNATR